MHVAGDMLYGADLTALVMIDVSDPQNASIVGQYGGGGGESARAAGGYAYVTGGGFPGLSVVDVTDPANPTLAGSYDTNAHVYDLAVEGNYVYLATIIDLQVIDVSDPTSPALASSSALATSPDSVEVVGNHAFVVSWQGLRIYDVTDPTAARFSSASTSPIAKTSQWSGTARTSPATRGTYGVDILDISDPTLPVLIDSFEEPDNGAGLCVAGQYVHFVQGMACPSRRSSRDVVDTDADTAQSLAVGAPAVDVQRVRLTTTEVGTVAWAVTADGGANWQTVNADGNWNDLSSPGQDLRWRATLSTTGSRSRRARAWRSSGRPARATACPAPRPAAVRPRSR